MNPSSVIGNGHKTRFASELEDMVFLLKHLYESQPVSSRTFLEELKKARWFSFRGKSNKEAAPFYTFGFVVPVVDNPANPTTAIGLYMNSITTERQRKTLAVTKLVEHRIKTTASKLNKTMVPS